METNKNIDLTKLNYDIPIEECFNALIPHPKFTGCTFDNYKEDINYPSQLFLKNKLKEIPVNNSKKKPFSLKNLFGGKKEITENIYIDGTYGIGKTHLLSALFHFFDDSKAFLSFLELTYFINYYGLEKTIEEFKKVKLLLLDEFDLDDPATTRMMARFIAEVNQHTTIVTTSNRLPKELGGTNFDTQAFARELGIIADSFTTIVVEGESFRIKLGKWQASYSDNNFHDVYKSFMASASDVDTSNKVDASVNDINISNKVDASVNDINISNKVDASVNDIDANMNNASANNIGVDVDNNNASVDKDSASVSNIDASVNDVDTSNNVNASVNDINTNSKADASVNNVNASTSNVDSSNKINNSISKIKYEELNKILQANHPFKFFVIPNNVSVLFIEEFEGFTKLTDALRFSVFVDHCYYYDTKLFFDKEMDRHTLFPKEILETTFERQFLRCLSRLDEMAIFFKG